MPRFLYRAKADPAAGLVEGTVEAEDLRAAVVKVSLLGLIPVDLLPESPALGSISPRGLRRGVSSRWIAICTRQLSDLLESGLTMLNALNIVAKQIPHPRLKTILQDVAEAVRAGSTLADALARHPPVFSRLYVAMVRAGEAAGALETVLNRIADAVEAEEELKAKIWTALTYPLFLSAVGLLTIGVLLGLVIPRLSTMFSDMGQMLPLPTRIILGVSHGITRFGWMIAVAVGLAGLALRRMIRSAEGKRGWDRLLLKVPVVGRLILQAEIARLGRTMGTLLTQGIPMLQGLQIVRETVGNELLREDLARVERAVAAGSSVAQATQNARTIPVFVQNMILVGETSGRLEQALGKVASAYEREVDRSVKVLTTLLEPALILFMGVIVGGIVMAMLLPIFQLNLMVR